LLILINSRWSYASTVEAIIIPGLLYIVECRSTPWLDHNALFADTIVVVFYTIKFEFSNTSLVYSVDVGGLHYSAIGGEGEEA
jgi:hypothetical protein